jgi:hypothetical protein
VKTWFQSLRLQIPLVALRLGVSLDRARGGSGNEASGAGANAGGGDVISESKASGRSGSGNDASAGEVGWRGNLVKCLHAQLGDRLVRGASANPVGDLVLRRLEELGVSTGGTEECWRECAPPPPSLSPSPSPSPPQGE